MDRAKLVASTLIGVVIAANACGTAHGQNPSRFIVQPPKGKQPNASAPAVATKSTNTASTSPFSSPSSPSGTNSFVPATGVPQSLALVEPDQRAPRATASILAPRVSDSPHSNSRHEFPTLSPGSSGDLSRASSDSRAAASRTDYEEQIANSAAQYQSSSMAQSNRVATKSPSATGGLQWTSRADDNRASIPATNSNDQFSQSNQFQPEMALTSTSYRDPAPASSSRLVDTSTAPSNSLDLTSPVSNTSNDWRALEAANEQMVANNQLLSQIADRVGAIETKIDKADEPAERAQVRAALVSAQITNDPRFAVDHTDQLSIGRIESPQGWQAIGSRLTNHVTRCESLLRRGAFCSSREEGESACLLLIRHIDLIDNLYRGEPAWLAATQSLREAEDFLAVQRMSDSDGLRRVIDSHHTPILKGKNLSELSPLTAAQHYRIYAEMQLLEATQGHPWASELLYAVGRTYQAEADATPSNVDVLRMRAMAFYQAARGTLPSNSVACNQLGYLLLQMDRNEEAREVLAAAVTLKSDPAFLSNFAEASRRLGDSQSVAWAAQSLAAIRSRTPVQPPLPRFLEVTPEEFVAISPRAIGPQPTMENVNSATVAPAYRSAATPRSGPVR